MESDPALYTPDTHVSSHLWQEEGVERGGGEMSTLTLKAKACTPSAYRWGAVLVSTASDAALIVYPVHLLCKELICMVSCNCFHKGLKVL